MSNPNALLLLADHIKLSLLERQRAKTLNLGSDSPDGHLSRSLDQFRDGLESLQKEQTRLEESGDESKASNLADTISSLQKQYHDLTSQFHGYASPATASTLSYPNDPSLAADFAHAQSSTSATSPRTSTDLPAVQPKITKKPSASKTVRFSDRLDLDLEAGGQTQPKYRDNPTEDDGDAGYRDTIEGQGMSNLQVHEYHRRILEDQDAQLDALGQSISRQRELSMQIGDELDSQVMMLDESERVVDRHQGRLDRARRQMGRIARGASESKQMTVIVVLIVILVLLIIILK
ncbi:hypothetical protein B0H66DRAFT_563879 [Apodospora peruviana]|uniref:t-SNARE coiled-coil homology domain-containing protein n=1 Tax=Apodospora peruviana TaxID=516989 RepID=A0AAE0HXR8_9PEZI|nr:hypothetical protein B0H66DRAFT_563879 [Apodospora peruviana]